MRSEYHGFFLEFMHDFYKSRSMLHLIEDLNNEVMLNIGILIYNIAVCITWSWKKKPDLPLTHV